MVHNWKAYFVPVPLEKPSTSATSWRPRYSNIDPNWEKTMPWRLAIGALMVVSQGKAHVKIDEHEFNWVQDQNRMSKVKTWIEMLFDLKRTHHKPLSLQTLPSILLVNIIYQSSSKPSCSNRLGTSIPGNHLIDLIQQRFDLGAALKIRGLYLTRAKKPGYAMLHAPCIHG